MTITVTMPRAEPLAAWVTAPSNDDHEQTAYRDFYAERYPRPEGSISLDERVA
jgi:hypothetical protein